jgi:hypothetical protein
VQRAMRVFDSVTLYEQLRVNASESVMDLSVVGLAWYTRCALLRVCFGLPIVDEWFWKMVTQAQGILSTSSSTGVG